MSPVSLSSRSAVCGGMAKTLRHVSRPSARCQSRGRALSVRAHKVELNFEGTTHVLEVGADETILSVAIDAGLEVPHDCDMGVCMTCPAKLVCPSIKYNLHNN